MADSNESLKPIDSAEKPFIRRDLSEKEAVEAVLSVARQVATLHAAGTIHRAISLATIEFDQNQRPRLRSFPAETEFGGPLGENDICPPELQSQISISLPPSIPDAQRILDARGITMAPQRVDVYQLGALLCQLLTGESVNTYLQSAKCKRRVPPNLRELIDAALGYEPKIRCQTVTELLRGLDTDSRDTATHGDTDPQRNEVPFQRLAHYEILERIGHGGMGDVYKGYERALDRVVAIKVLPAEFGRQQEFVTRFRAEAAAVASLTHPNVIQIHFIGEDQGHHFFAMQYVAGETLGDRIRRQQLDVPEAMSVLEQVLAGLSAAHRRGIVHRDIKPANVLLDREHGRALVADFGLVKSIGGAEKMTATGIVLGTVDYISPEQARGHKVDARSDLYSVGILAYQLFSGRLPFEADSITAMIFQHVYEQAKPLQEIARSIPRPVCAVVEKLMAKSPDQRYQTADEVLADFAKIRAENAGLHVARKGENLGAKTAIIQVPRFETPSLPDDLDRVAPLGWWQQARQQWMDRLRRRQPRFVQRLQNTQHQVDGALYEYEARRNNLQQLVAEAEEILDQLRRHDAEYRAAAESAQRRADDAIDDQEAKEALQEKAACLRCAEELVAPIADQQSQLESMRLKLAQISATLDKIRTQRDLLNARLKVAQARTALADERPKATALQRVIRVLILAVAGAAIVILAAVYWPKTPRTATPAPSANSPKSPAESYSLTTGEAGERIVTYPHEARSMALAPSRLKGFDFVFAVGNSDGSLNLFNSFSNRQMNRPVKLSGHIQRINDVAFSPDGKLFATASEEGVINIWDTRSHVRSRELRRLESTSAPVNCLLFSADSAQLLTASRDGALRLWDVVREQELHNASILEWIQAMDWSRDGRRVLLGYRLNGGNSMALLNLYDPLQPTIFDTKRQRTDAVWFSRLEDQAICFRNGSICVYNVRTQELVKEFGQNIRSAAFSRDTNRAWTADSSHGLALWDIETGSVMESFVGHTDAIVRVAISLDGTQGISVSRDGTARIWDLPPAPPPANQLLALACDGPIAAVTFSPDGFSALASAANDLALWDLDSGTVDRKYGIKAEASSAAFATDGLTFVYAAGRADSKLGIVGMRDVQDALRRDKRQFEGADGYVSSVAMSSGMRYVAAGGADGIVRVWIADTAQEAGRLDVGERVNAVEFTKQDDALLIGSDGTAVRLWKWNTSKEVVPFEGHSFRVVDIAISADGSRAATASGDRSVHIWDLATGQSVAKLTGHSGAVNSVALSEHGLIAVSGSDDTTVRLWDVMKQTELQRFEGHSGKVRSVALSRDGTRALSGGDDGILRIWKLPITIQ